ncbi:MAG: DNA polymerase III subunit delta' [Desulfosalsimonadaceae bacterium]
MSTSNSSRPRKHATGFDAIIGQQRQIRMLAAALQKKEVPHAMLFTGEAGIGKKTTAIHFAMACNCTHPMPMAGGFVFSGSVNPCGECRPCRKIASGNHPDVYHIQPPGATIKIEQIRTLCSALALRPHEALLRVVLLSDAHLMNAEAGNALLKVLEEPPEKTIFILAAPEAADILPTIVSRCRHLRFNPIPEDQLEAFLVEHRGMTPENAMIVASMANGSIGRALSICDDDWILHHRRRVIEQMEIIFRKAAGQDLCFSEMLAQDRKKLGFSLEIMKSWLRDLAVSQYFPEKVCNRDIRGQLAALAKTVDMDGLIEKTDAVWQAERAVKTNANARLAIEAMMMRLSE